MGGYVSLLYQNYPGVDLWSCRVIYITPNGIKTQDFHIGMGLWLNQENIKLF